MNIDKKNRIRRLQYENEMQEWHNKPYPKEPPPPPPNRFVYSEGSSGCVFSPLIFIVLGVIILLLSL